MCSKAVELFMMLSTETVIHMNGTFMRYFPCTYFFTLSYRSLNPQLKYAFAYYLM